MITRLSCTEIKFSGGQRINLLKVAPKDDLTLTDDVHAVDPHVGKIFVHRDDDKVIDAMAVGAKVPTGEWWRGGAGGSLRSD